MVTSYLQIVQNNSKRIHFMFQAKTLLAYTLCNVSNNARNPFFEKKTEKF